MFTVYAPDGIDTQSIQAHLQDIRDFVLIVSPDAKLKALQIFGI
jgi:hypothetical protein